MLASVVRNRISWTFTGKTRRHTIVFEHNTLSGSRKVYVNGSTFVQSGWKFDLTGALTFVLEPGYTIEIMIKADDLGSLFYYLSVNGKEITPDNPSVTRLSGTKTAQSPSITNPASPSASSSSATGTPATSTSSSSSLFSFFHSSSTSSVTSPNNSIAHSTPSKHSQFGDYVWNVALPDGCGIFTVEFFTSSMDILINNIKINCEGTFADDGPGTIYRIPITREIYGTLTAIPLSPAERKIKGHGKDMECTLTVDKIGEIPPSELLD